MNNKICTRIGCNHQDQDHICVDYSQLHLNAECELAEYLSYGLGIQSRAIPSPKNPFLFGTIEHHAMETFYQANSWRNTDTALHAAFDLFSASQARDPYSDQSDTKIEWAALWSDLKDCVTCYAEYSEEIDKDYKPLAPETPFELCLKQSEPKVYFYGKFDNPVIRISDNKICIMEFKFHAQMSEDPLYLEWDPQTNDYSLAGGFVFGDKWGGIDYRITRKQKSPTLVNFVRKSPEEMWRESGRLKRSSQFIVVQALKIYRDRKVGPNSLIPVISNNPISVANVCYRCQFRDPLCDAFCVGEDWETLVQTHYTPRYAYAEHDDVPAKNKETTEKEELRVF